MGRLEVHVGRLQQLWQTRLTIHARKRFDVAACDANPLVVIVFSQRRQRRMHSIIPINSNAWERSPSVRPSMGRLRSIAP